jgi:hypothetical protein
MRQLERQMMRYKTTKFASLDESLRSFDEALPSADHGVRDLLVNIRDAVLRTKAELDQIHISLLPHPTGVQPICFDCGNKHLEVIYTSKRDRCQLCAPCFHKREQRGAARGEARGPQSTSLSNTLQ